MSKGWKHFAAAMLSLAGLAAPHGSASAADITFAVIGPREYELPVNYKDFFAFVQYGQFNSSSQYFDARGNLTSQPRQNLAVGLSKFVYFTTFDSLPGVGIAFEAILPEAYLGVRGGGEQLGFGDTIWGVATWIKPTENSTLGFQTFLQAPIGTDNFTNNYYANLSSILFDDAGRALQLYRRRAASSAASRTRRASRGSIRHDVPHQPAPRLQAERAEIPGRAVPVARLPVQHASDLALSHLIIPNSHGQDLALGAGLAWFYDPSSRSPCATRAASTAST